MPFDFSETTSTTKTVCDAIAFANAKGATVAAKRTTLLNAVDLAKDDAFASVDWRSLALALADALPVPRTAAKADPDAGEWTEYTDAQRKGRAGNFYGGRVAAFRFADGEVVRVSLCHKKSLDAPDWARAANCAVAFYKARRTANFLKLVGGQYGFTETHAETYANGCAVPEIVEAVDRFRNVTCAIDKANAHTLTRREGPIYLSQLAQIAADCDGDWMQAWTVVRRAYAITSAPEDQRALAYLTAY